MISTRIVKPSIRSFGALPIVCLCALLISSPVAGQKVLLDKVIAVVDEEVVLQSELVSRSELVREQAQQTDQFLPEGEEFRDEVIELLVMENLQMQLANRMSIRFDDDAINGVISNMAAQANMSFDDYVAQIRGAGDYLQTRNEIRKQVTMQDLQRGVVNRRITITDQEIENFLTSDAGKEFTAANYFVDDILIPTSSSDSTAANNAKLEYAADLTARLQEGEDFATMRVTAQQEGKFQVGGSQLGWRKADTLPSIFTDIVLEMEVNDVNGPIPAGNGFHIIKLLSKRGGTEQIIQQTRIRHIMLTSNEVRDEEQTFAALQVIRQRIIDGESFATLARQNSNDASSVVAGGDLDWINEGGMPAQMAVVVNELEEGVISDVFQSDVGWHITEVTGRRETDMGRQFSRSQAERALRERKYDLELQNWLIEIRDEAYVQFIE